VDGQQVAQGKIEHTVPSRISGDETMDIGEDTGTPVVEDYVDKMPFKFTGKIEKVAIEMQKARAADKGEVEQSRKEASLKKMLLD
jgi:arylsulfatase